MEEPILTRQAQRKMREDLKEEKRLAAEQAKAAKDAAKEAKAAGKAAAKAAREEAKAAKAAAKSKAKGAAKKGKGSAVDEAEPVATPLRKRGQPSDDLRVPMVEGDDGNAKPKGRGREREEVAGVERAGADKFLWKRRPACLWPQMTWTRTLSSTPRISQLQSLLRRSAGARPRQSPPSQL